VIDKPKTKRVLKKRLKQKPIETPVEDPAVDPLLSVSTESSAITEEAALDAFLDTPVLDEQPTPQPEEPSIEPAPEPQPTEPVQKKKVAKKKPAKAKKKPVEKKKGDPCLEYLAGNPGSTVEEFRDATGEKEPLAKLQEYMASGLVSQVSYIVRGIPRNRVRRYSLTDSAQPR